MHTTWLRALVGAFAVATLLTTADAANSNPAAQNPATQSAQKPKAKPKILVLGAGMSGVMAATTLFEKGFKDITIIEANDYIGGRMKAGSFAGRKIELGANWIQGADGNPIYDIALQQKLNVMDTNFSSVVYLPVGADPNEEKEVEKFDEAWAKTEERAKRYRDTGKKDLSVRDGLLYEGWTPRTPLEKALLFNAIDADMGPAEGTSFEQAMNIATYNNDDRNVLVADARGFNNIPREILAKNFPNPLNNKNVLLNTKVNKIIHTPKGVTVTATNTKGKSVSYNADYVITTFSAGVLRNKARDLFVPSLPEDKLDAIYRVDMTLFLKVFVETTENFWAKETGGVDTWVFANDVRGNFTSWLDMSLPKLDSVFGSKNASYVSLCMIAGDFAAQMQKLSNTQLKDEVIKAMKAMFPKAASRINTKTVTSVLMNTWGTDDNFGGSWSNPPRDFTKDDFAKLGEPVGRVYFSGEHTSAEYFGYVHGGYHSGVQTAKQLLQLPEFQ